MGQCSNRIELNMAVFVKEFDPNSSSVSTTDNSKLLEELANENNYVRSEYDKLLALYRDAKAKLDAETQRVKAEDSQPIKEKLEAEMKVIRNEKKVIEKKNESYILDIKRFKEEISDLKKDRNALSVAVKASKKEQSEQFKRTDLKINELEKKIVTLTEYKNKRLNEDRELKERT